MRLILAKLMAHATPLIVSFVACNNHGGKSINAHLISIQIIYKPNQSYFFGSLGENPSYKVQSKNVNITLSIFT